MSAKTIKPRPQPPAPPLALPPGTAVVLSAQQIAAALGKGERKAP